MAAYYAEHFRQSHERVVIMPELCASFFSDEVGPIKEKLKERRVNEASFEEVLSLLK